MCLTTLQRKPNIAEEDIYVFKHLYQTSVGFLYSPVMAFDYPEKGELPSVEMTTRVLELNVVDTKIQVEEGYHTLKYLSDTMNALWQDRHKSVIALAVIPKGTPYYKGYWYSEIESYTSSTIKLLGIIFDSESTTPARETVAKIREICGNEAVIHITKSANEENYDDN